MLVFLPGIKEITALQEALLATREYAYEPARSWVLPVHSSVPAEEQRLAFARAPPGVRKVVLATNIAETAITIDDSIKTMPRYIKLNRNKKLSLEEISRYYAVRAGCGIRSAVFLHWEDARHFVAVAGSPSEQRVEYATFTSIEEAARYLVEGEREKKKVRERETQSESEGER